MRTYPLKAEQVTEFLAGATTLRVPVRPQPEVPPECGMFVDANGVLWYTAIDASGCPWTWHATAAGEKILCPYPVGSELALTETWMLDGCDGRLPFVQRGLITGHVIYKAESPQYGKFYKWRSPVTMPAEFSRFKRLVTAVKVEHRELWEWVLALEEYLEREDK